MKLRPLLECTLDLTDPVAEIAAVISAVIGMLPDKQTEILRALDDEIGSALAGLESDVSTEGAAQEAEG